ncbi:erythromycin esterase family protein [Nonomuraea sp. ZG12]|uniref:erythromycin esterase family protein n=1 Tax=Nonomuraea sp. ZG12 TaxID=3452207 RepID=UPI003F8BB980
MTAVAVPEELTGWLAGRAIRLAALEPGAPVADLEPLRPALDGVRVVGLGEATHGTREFFLLKHRLLRFLVEELGFTVLAMEASVSAAEAVNDYVLHGTGDAAEALGGMVFWTWHTREMLGVVEWMREYNRAAPPERKVRFAGIDPQYPAASIEWLARYLGEVAPAFLEPLAALGQTRLGVDGPLDPAVETAARRLEDFLATGPGSAGEAIAHARTLRQSAVLASRPMRHADPQQTVGAVRDLFLADNVDRLLGDPAVKVAVWAHNGHVMSGNHGGGPVPAMGRHLRQRHGAAYYALGLLMGEGEFRARRMRFGRPDTRKPPVRNRVPSVDNATMVEARLAAACPDDHLLDLRTGERSEGVARWLGSRLHVRAYGAVVSRLTYKFRFAPTVLADDYDGLAFIRSGTCSTPL